MNFFEKETISDLSVELGVQNMDMDPYQMEHKQGEVYYIKKSPTLSTLAQLLLILFLPILAFLLMIPSGLRSLYYLVQIARNIGMNWSFSSSVVHCFSLVYFEQVCYILRSRI